MCKVVTWIQIDFHTCSIPCQVYLGWKDIDDGVLMSWTELKVLSAFLQMSAVRSRELLNLLANIFYNQMFQVTGDEIFSNSNSICQASDTWCLQLCLPSVVQVHQKSHISCCSVSPCISVLWFSHLASFIHSSSSSSLPRFCLLLLCSFSFEVSHQFREDKWIWRQCCTGWEGASICCHQIFWFHRRSCAFL